MYAHQPVCSLSVIWWCRLSGKPLQTVTVEYRNLRIEADALVGSAGEAAALHAAAGPACVPLIFIARAGARRMLSRCRQPLTAQVLKHNRHPVTTKLPILPLIVTQATPRSSTPPRMCCA